MYYLQPGYEKHHRFRTAVLLAAATHIALVLAISFSYEPPGQHQTPQIEVTLSLKPSKTAPDDAKRLAAANQRGRSEETELPIIGRPAASAEQRAATGEPASSMPAPVSEAQDAVTARLAPRRAGRGRVQQTTSLAGINPQIDRLNHELAGLEADLDQQQRSYAEMPRVRRLTSVSARRSVDAAYLLDWRRRVEAVGNKYYPEASVRYGIYGSLRMLVVIGRDGALEQIRVLSPSGYAVLDEAAIKIVRMAAPFAPFPKELRASTDRLEIIRTWKFEKNRLSSR